MLVREFQAPAIATGEQFFLPAPFPAVNGTDRMDHILRRQIVSPGNLRVAGLATTQSAAFFKQFRPGCAMDCPIHAASAEKRGIGGIDDRINLKLCYIALDD